MKSGAKIWIAALSLLALIGGGLAWTFFRDARPSPATDHQEEQASANSLPEGLSAEEYQSARVAFFSRYNRVPLRLDALSFAGEAALDRKDFATAAACFAEIPSEHAQYGHIARYQQGFALLKLNQSREAERQLRAFLRLEQDAPQWSAQHHQDAMQRLRYILEVELRFRERCDLLREMHERGLADMFDTLAYCFPTLLRWNGPAAVHWCEGFWKTDPSDPKIAAAMARYRAGQGRLDEAKHILKSINEKSQADPHVQAAWLFVYSEEGHIAAMEQMVQCLPPAKDGEPWLLLRMRGHAHNRAGRFADAERCFRLVLKTDPANPESTLGLATAFAGQRRFDERKQMLKVAEVLGRIQNRLGWAERETARKPLAEIAQLSREIGLIRQGDLIAEIVKRISLQPEVNPQSPKGPRDEN